ncbi:MAG: hypothetical protein P0Y66_11770 [Candidatus Kaistia colombiensis]|nr:MAG: hypothetical protein P0Y66_11770 [Kaistia sp.]
MRMPGLGLAVGTSVGRRVAPPSGLGFPFADYPLALRRRGERYLADIEPEAYAAAALAGPGYFVDIATGHDGNAGTSWGAALKSIFVATQLGNAGGLPFNVSVKSGVYPRANSFTNSGPMVIPTQPVVYRAVGGRVTCWAGGDLGWPGAPDGTHGACYAVARSNVTVVLDLAQANSFGDPAELARVADATTCNATAGSWAQVGGTLYVHRADGAAPTNANTQVLLVVDAFVLDGTAKSVYLQGFDFQGGANGGVFVYGAATRSLVFVDCSARYAGGPSHLYDGFRILDTSGLAVLVRCLAGSNAKDGFNFHWGQGGTPSLYHLTVDCRAYDNGRFESQSNNGLTSHDGLVGIDVGGLYHDNFGGNVVSNGASRLWCLGTETRDSLGDGPRGGAVEAVDFNTQDTTTFWLERTKSSGSARSLVAGDASAIRLRRHRAGEGQAQLAASGATIAAY